MDDMHAWYHNQPPKLVPRGEVGSFLMSDSIVALKKAVNKERPGRTQFGG